MTFPGKNSSAVRQNTEDLSVSDLLEIILLLFIVSVLGQTYDIWKCVSVLSLLSSTFQPVLINVNYPYDIELMLPLVHQRLR